MTLCRLCNSIYPPLNLLTYRNMPKSAQFFPDRDNLDQDKGIDIVINECPFCGLVQAAGEPVHYFRDVIRASAFSEEMRNFRKQQFTEWVSSNGLEGKKIIEIGSGKGEYLSIMETTGAIAFGLEHNEVSLNEARDAGRNMILGFVEDEYTDIPGAPYDAFFCLNFLEHMPYPGKFLRGIAKNLSDNAFGLVEVPNFSMMLAENLYSEFIQDHLSYFTAQTFFSLLNINGFEVLSLQDVWYGYILSAKVRKRRGVDIGNMLNNMAVLKQKVAEFISTRKKAGKKIAVWGAGHQALANLSLLDMAQNIDYVIDSAVFKQNKFTPATHIPIVSPEILSKGTIQTVIIMGAGYSNEIKAIMSEKYPSIETVILSNDLL